MCGLAGVWGREGHAADGAIVERMLDAIRYRGPDDRGLCVERDLALGHVRLSILDLSERARQPLRTPDGHGVIAYNGEVYNFRELRADLQAEGEGFESTGDTEVVLRALHRWGPAAAIPRFNGMFAFAYFDGRARSLTLARDRLGIKPLYVSRRRTPLVFGSELKALLQHPSVSPQPDLRAVATYLQNLTIDPPLTMVDGIEALAAGSYWTVTPDGLDVVVYFDPARDLDPARVAHLADAPLERMADDFAARLDRGVGAHLLSDVPVATMCSGGVDSSLITALAARHIDGLTAYVADLEGTLSEGAVAQRVGRHLNVPVRQVDVSIERYLRLWPHAAWYGDQPTRDANGPSMLAVAQACREDGIKVILTGEGADELFGGYGWPVDVYRLWRRRRRLQRWLPMLKPDRRWTRLPRRLMPWLAWPSDHLLLGDPLTPLPLDIPVDLRARLAHEAFHAEPTGRARTLIERLRGSMPVEDAAYLASGVDSLYWHLHGLLQRNDRMCMAAGVESRVPFLDTDMIDFGLHLPRRLKWRRGVTKPLVKAAAERHLPRQVVHAPKIGFACPTDQYRAAADLIRDGLLPDIMRWSKRATDGVLEFGMNNPRRLYSLGSVELWARLFLAGEHPDTLGEALVAAG